MKTIIKKTILLILIFSAGVLASYGYLNYRENKSKTKNLDADIFVEEEVKSGSIIFKPVNETNNLTLNEPAVFTLIASSESRPIVGYDIVLRYETDEFELVESESIVPGFNVYVFKDEDGITITTLKDINDKMTTVFDNTPILSLMLKPLEKGSFDFDISEKRGKQTTQMVDNKTKVLKPETNSIRVVVE